MQRQAYKIIYGWGVDYSVMVEEGMVETLQERREKSCLKFAKKNKDTARFKHWFPLAPNNREVWDSTRRRYLEKKAKTERTRNNPLQVMARMLNENI